MNAPKEKMSEKRPVFGAEVRRLRLGAGLTQAQAAEIVGRDANTVARWERGELIPEPLVCEAVLARLRSR